jgi:hypothetical protein
MDLFSLRSAQEEKAQQVVTMSTTHASEDSKSKGGLRIYFAGSIRGESVDKSVLRALIGHLQTHGM